jgi:hypothetical protein
MANRYASPEATQGALATAKGLVRLGVHRGCPPRPRLAVYSRYNPISDISTGKHILAGKYDIVHTYRPSSFRGQGGGPPPSTPLPGPSYPYDFHTPETVGQISWRTTRFALQQHLVSLAVHPPPAGLPGLTTTRFGPTSQ